MSENSASFGTVCKNPAGGGGCGGKLAMFK